MLTSIHIQGFKGFRDTKIPELRRVNLILGGQNSGKTSLLEVLAIGLSGKNLQSELGQYFRGDIQQQLFWSSLISQQSSEINVEMVADEGSINWSLNAAKQSTQEPKAPLFHTAQVSGLHLAVHRPAALTQDEKLIQTYPAWVPRAADLLKAFKPISEERAAETRLLKELQGIDQRIDDIRFSPPNEVLVGMKNLAKRVNIQLLGQGINRLAVILFGLLTSKAKFAAIDEIENGVHYQSLPIIWQGIADISRKENIQLFITTHSYECIRAAAKVFESTPEEFQLIRLERTEDNNIKPVLVQDENLVTVLQESYEIR
jgi:AAA15 family ATPase/GTPase